MSFFSSLIDAPLSFVELLGHTVEVLGEVTNNEFLKDTGKTIVDNADTIAK